MQHHHWNVNGHHQEYVRIKWNGFVTHRRAAGHEFTKVLFLLLESLDFQGNHVFFDPLQWKNVTGQTSLRGIQWTIFDGCDEGIEGFTVALGKMIHVAMHDGNVSATGETRDEKVNFDHVFPGPIQVVFGDVQGEQATGGLGQ